MIQLINKYDAVAITAILTLEKEAFGIGAMNEWHLVPLIRHGKVFVWRENESIVGSVQYFLDWQHPKRAYMYGIAIAKLFQGNGLGTLLLKETFEKLKEHGLDSVELTVSPDNEAAINVYQNKMGFHAVGLRKAEYGQGEDRVVMIKTLLT